MNQRKQKLNAPPIIEAQLYDDETLLWWGAPKPTFYVIRHTDWSAFLGGLVVVAVSGIFMSALRAMPVSDGFGGPPPIFSAMFTLIPLIILLVGVWYATGPGRKFIEAQRTLYALTDRRALIVHQMLSTQVKSYYDTQIEKLDTHIHSDGTGDIIFDTEVKPRAVRNRRRVSFRDVHHGFMGIEDPRGVEDLMAQLFFEDDDTPDKRKHSIDDYEEGAVVDLERLLNDADDSVNVVDDVV